MNETVHRLAEQAYLQKTWLTLKEAARYAGITTTTLRSWRDGGLPESRVEGRIYIKRDHLDGWIEEHLTQEEKRAA
jgi:excisionase family DNA binding protein